jgi:hypothetical protein
MMTMMTMMMVDVSAFETTLSALQSIVAPTVATIQPKHSNKSKTKTPTISILCDKLQQYMLDHYIDVFVGNQ